MYEFAKQEKRCWKCGDAMLSLERALVMGILNVTPDSFSDGGLYLDTAAAVEHAHQMIDEGADIIDVGGESTRPGAQSVSIADELKRVIPVIKALKTAVKVPVSIDTRHAVVAQSAVDEGASIVNNIMPIDGDAALARMVAECGVGLVVMHMRGTPDTMNDQAFYDDVVIDVFNGLKVSLDFALENGIEVQQMVVDPGIGFAKKLNHNLELLAGLEKFMELAPVMVGLSRKRFVGEICNVHSAADRVGGSLGAAVWSILHGASIIRVHDVKESFQAVSVLSALCEAGEKRA
ncbi:MAG: dihydropteroate synthase [Kiritimatiellae bacterium]|jgi:dihydropteroate synthase|nr:dihydropteroate synthase [Kiritimatiellia bacterium]